jgi:hypothetical protein
MLEYLLGPHKLRSTACYDYGGKARISKRRPNEVVDDGEDGYPLRVLDAAL